MGIGRAKKTVGSECRCNVSQDLVVRLKIESELLFSHCLESCHAGNNLAWLQTPDEALGL